MNCLELHLVRKSPFVELTSLLIERPRSGPPLVIDVSHCGRVVALDLHNLARQFGHQLLQCQVNCTQLKNIDVQAAGWTAPQATEQNVRTTKV